MTGRTMKAWQLDRFGLANLMLADRTVPDPGPDEVTVRVGAVSLNYRDLLVVEGELLPAAPEMPFVPVSDFAGEIIAVGSNVRNQSPGERVMGNFWVDWIDGTPPRSMATRGRSLGGLLPGGLAEFVVIPADAAVRSPANLSDEEASTLPVAALTAWFALTEAGNTRKGDVVVVQGTGGVALAGLQFAKALGATVIVISRSDEKLAKITELEPTGSINTTVASNWAEEVLRLTEGKGADHVLEVIGGDNVAISADALAPEGRISMIGFLAGADFHLSAVPLILNRGTIRGVSVGHRRAFTRMVEFIQSNEIHPVIDSVHEFKDAHHAFSRLAGGPLGKVVLRVSQD